MTEITRRNGANHGMVFLEWQKLSLHFMSFIHFTDNRLSRYLLYDEAAFCPPIMPKYDKLCVHLQL
ncbi:MAG: hypothetical protein HXO07_05725 [Prevotella salivae]|nr:hypothetical protein [Segatella salivae]